MGAGQQALLGISAAAAGSSAVLPVLTGLQVDFDPNAYAGVDQNQMVGSYSNSYGVFEPRAVSGPIWQGPGTTHSCNNLATAYFDGTKYGGLFSAGPTLDGPILTSFTMFCVLKLVNNGASGHSIFGAASGGAEWRSKSDNKLDAQKSGGSNLGTCTTALSTAAFQQVAISYDGTTASFYKGGSADGTSSVSQTMTGKTQYIGNGTGGTGGGLNYWARGCIYNSVLSAPDLATMFAYFTSRYAVT